MKFLTLFPLLLFVIGLPVFPAAAADSPRRPPATLASLPAPAAAGALRILLVDDDLSDNNHYPDDKRLSPSDRIFRQLVADAVGGDANAWSVETVKPYASGPDVDRLRRFSLILWYTGSSYGGNPDNTAVLGIEDEKTVRRYLEETGGVVILVSPGYLSKVLGGEDTWEKAKWPFLSEVLGIRGGQGLAQRFLPGTVTASDGTQFNVGKGSATVESQFSLVNPERAAVLFTTLPAAAKNTGPATPVATVHAYGRGRIIYVGFTFENLAEADLAPAFRQLIAATGLRSTASPPVAAAPVDSNAPVVSSPEAEPATVQVSGTPAKATVTWTLQTATIQNASLRLPEQTAKKAQPKTAPAQTPTVKVERLVPNAVPVRLPVASTDTLKANDSGPLTPGRAVTYRVTLTDERGVTGFKEASFTPQAKDPDNLGATAQSDRTVVLTWPEVPGVASYQVSGTTLAAPVIVRSATQWQSPPQSPGSQQWKVASLYEPGGVLTAASTWPSVMSRVVPTPGRPFLSMPNGAGSIGESTDLYYKQCESSRTGDQTGATCPDAAWFLSLSTGWLQTYDSKYGGGPVPPSWPMAAFADLNDLGLGRRVNCTILSGTPRITMCWATSHGNIPAAGQPPNGNALAAAAENATEIKSLNIIITSAQGAFFGTWENARSMTGAMDTASKREDAFVDASGKRYLTALDSQSLKSVPNACLSCHGGRYDATRKIIVGASLLPLIPAHLHFTPQTRPNYEEQIRRINQIVLESSPSPTITTQITALYNGTPGTPGAPANDAAVPSGWASQPGLYRQVIAPYCGTCHFSQTGLLHFGTYANLQFNKQRVQKAVCTDFSMPHSEQGFRRFWSEGGTVFLPGLLSTVLGYPKCPQ